MVGLNKSAIRNFRPARDWEVAFRVAEIAWPIICDCSDVEKRRHAYRGGAKIDVAVPAQSKLVFDRNWDVFSGQLREMWLQTYDAWEKRQDDYLFEDGYHLLFFLKLLWCEDTLFLRGHPDDEWEISSTLMRERQNEDFDENLNRQKITEFIEVSLKAENGVTSATAFDLSEPHKQAIAQHYGFPTEYVDFTTNFEVALFFAEGCEKKIDKQRSIAAIFAVPPKLLGDNFFPLVLPDTILRPSLQHGAFLRVRDETECDALTGFKFRFVRRSWPICSSIGSQGFATSKSLNDYMFPKNDVLQRISDEIRGVESSAELKVSDSSIGRLQNRILHECVVDSVDGTNYKLDLMISLCNAQPKSAIGLIQFLHLRWHNAKISHGPDSKDAVVHRGMLGALLIASIAAANGVLVPAENQLLKVNLERLLRQNSELEEVLSEEASKLNDIG